MRKYRKSFFELGSPGFCLVLLLCVFQTICVGTESEKSIGEFPGLELNLELPSDFGLSPKKIQKIMTDYFNRNNLPIKNKSPLKILLSFRSLTKQKVSRLSPLVRVEFTLNVDLKKEGGKTNYYSFALNCKGLEEGEEAALESALQSLKMDERELDMLAEKLKELMGKSFY